MLAMREFLYKVFVEDLFLKTISLVVAVVLVFLVRTELEANSTLFVRVTYTEPHDRLMVSEPRVDQVKVVVRGPWGRINRAGETPVEPIHLDLSTLREGDLRFTAEMVRLPPGLRIESITPPDVYLHYEPEVTALVPVQLTIEGEPPEGYRFRQATATPRAVRVRGAQNVVENMHNVLSKPLKVTEIRDNVTVPVELAALPKFARFLDDPPPKIDAHVVVELVEKTFANVPIRTSGAPQNVKLNPETATIVLRGQGLEQVADVPELMLDTTAEERKPPGSKFVKRPQVVKLPPGIAYELRPAEVQFTIVKSEPAEKPGRKPESTEKPARKP
jgi:YbbR domain-containing protein